MGHENGSGAAQQPRIRSRPLATLRERLLADLMREQHGTVSRTQLLELGFGVGAIRHRLESGRIRTVHRGVYAAGAVRLDRAAKIRAALLASPLGSVLSHRCAGAEWQICTPSSAIEITSPARTERCLDGVALHVAELKPVDVSNEPGELPVTSLARTLLDLASVLQPAALDKAIEEGERLELIDLRAIDELLRRLPRARGRRRLLDALESFRPSGETLSPLEDRFTELLREFNLPEPHRNVLVHGLLVDVWWPQARLVVELDSRDFHAHWSAHERDRERDGRLLREGIATLRITDRRMRRDRKGIVTDVEARFREIAGAPAAWTHLNTLRDDPHQVAQ